MIVIGAGRIGTALAERAQEVGESCTLVTRTSNWSELDGPPGDPVLVAVRNDDLEQVVSRIPVHRRSDLVFIQNGMIRNWLRAHQLGTATRGLIYFAVPSKGAPIELGDRPNPFCGAHALSMVRWFITLKIPAQEVDWARFSALELEKLIWNSAFGLLCELYDADVGTVCELKRNELTALVEELSRVGQLSMGVDLPLGWLVERLCAYSSTIPRYRGAVKEWRWRNGWFDEVATRCDIPTPVHRSMLQAIGKGDLLMTPSV